MSYEFSRQYFDRANQDNELYEQIIDPNTWTTMSEVTLGLAYRLVQNTLPNLLFNVLWAPETPFELIPASADDDLVSADLAKKMREYMVYCLREKMQIESRGYLTVLDGVKFGCGYGIIEPTTVYMAERTTTRIEDGVSAVNISGLDVGQPKVIPQYRYCPFGSILPTPDGINPDDASAVSFVDTISEVDFRALYDSPENEMLGNPEEIISYAKNMGFDANTFTIRSIIAKLSGFSQDFVPKYGALRRKTKGITMIPVVKQFRKDKHIWVACDKFVIFKSGRTVETLQSPILKYTFSPEGGNWFTRGIVSPNRDIMRGRESFENAMLDLFTLHMHPHQIINLEMLQEADAPEDLQPYAKTYVRGEPSRAHAFATPPTVPPMVAGIGDRLQAISDDNAALNTPEGGRVSPGMVRGGSQALESVLQSSTNREKLLAKHLELTWYAPMIKLSAIYNSVYSDDEEKFFVVKIQNGNDSRNKRKNGDRYHEIVKITRDELSHTWRVTVDFREKLKNFLVESAHRLQVYDRLVKDPEVNVEELKQYLIGDERQMRRLLSGVDKEARLSDMQRIAQAVGPNQAGALNPNAPGGAMAGGGNPGQPAGLMI